MSTSKYADEGTIAHALAAMCLTEGKDAAAYVGRLIKSEDYEHAKLSPSGAARWMRCPGSNALETRIAFKPRTFSLQVTKDMAEGVQIYVDNVRLYAANTPDTSELMVEQWLPIEKITGEKDATGSGDACILDFAQAEIQVHDLKFGKGVEVFADDNEQLAMYLLGALEIFEEFAPPGGWKTFRGVIHQPRINPAPSEFVWTLAALREFEEKCKAGAQAAILAKKFAENWVGKPDATEYLTPGDKQCKFCDAKATCPAVAKLVSETVLGDFAILADAAQSAPVTTPIEATPENKTLALYFSRIELIEGWCKAVASKVEQEILAGRAVPGFKAVTGKRGNRAWTSAEQAEEALKTMRLKHDQMYDYKVISPTSAEKLSPKLDKFGKPKPGEETKPLGARQWQKLQQLISQAPGNPTVVPESDKRPALVITPAADDFTELDPVTQESAEELV